MSLQYIHGFADMRLLIGISPRKGVGNIHAMFFPHVKQINICEGKEFVMTYTL